MAKEDKDRQDDEAPEAESPTEHADEEAKDKAEETTAPESRKRARLSARERRAAREAAQEEAEAPRRRKQKTRRAAEGRGEWGIWPSLCLVATILVIAFGVIEGLAAKNTKGSPWVRPSVNFVTVIFWLLLAYYAYKRDLGRSAGLLLGLGAYHMLGALVAWLVTDSKPMAIVLAGLGVVWFVIGAIVAVKWERERRGQAGGTLGMRAAEAEPLPPFEWNVWVIVALALATVAIGGNVYYGVSKGAWLAPTLGFLVAAALIALAYWAGRRAAGVCGTILLGAGGLCTMSAMVAWLVTGGEGVFAIVTFLAEGAALLVAGGIVLARAPGRTWTTIGKPLIGLAALILFVGILGLVNFIAVRYGGEWKWDSTENKYYSLSDMTRQIVKKLDQPVEVVGFYTAGPWSQRDEADRLYRQYNDLSPKLKTALYDTRLDLAQVKKYNPPSNNVTIVKCGDNRKEVYSVNEQDITSAILEVTERKKKKVYFLEGHGERAIEGGDENSYTHVAGKLRDLQYDVETLNLISGEEAGSSDTVVLDEATEEKAGEVPGDCSVLCIVGPKMPLRESEIEAINDYLDRGGDAFIALGGPGDPDLSEVLSRWEIKVGEGNVIDPGASWFGSPTLVTVIPQRDHPVLKDLNRVVTALPLPRPIETTEESPPPSPYAPSPPQPDSVSLFSSSSASWEETGITPETTEVSRDPDERSGPLSLAVAVDAPPKTGPDAEEEPEPPSNPWEPPKERTKGKQRTRMVVIGTTDFAEDDYARQVKGNEALFLNSINWLAERTKLISLPPKEKGEHRLNLTGNVRRFVMLLTLILAPLSVAIVGGIVWWVRR